MNNLINLFNSILPISNQEQILLKKHIKTDFFSKGNSYNNEGKICRKLGFVENGIFKVSSFKSDGEEFIKYFVSEGHFAIDLNSFFYKTPSKENIIALTNCKVLTITSSSYEFLENNILNFSKIINDLKQKALIEKFAIKNEMFVEDALTKYTKFVQRSPTIVQRVSQKHIASHLGISQYTLSRIRSKKSFFAI